MLWTCEWIVGYCYDVVIFFSCLIRIDFFLITYRLIEHISLLTLVHLKDAYEVSGGWASLKSHPWNSTLGMIFIWQNYDLNYTHIYVWQVHAVLPQLSCGNTCQIWTWYEPPSLICHHRNDSVMWKWTKILRGRPQQYGQFCRQHFHCVILCM